MNTYFASEEPALVRIVKARKQERETIKELLQLIDELRRPYMNTRRHDLYEHANEVLNSLEEEERI